MGILLTDEEINEVEEKWLMGEEWNDDCAKRRMLLEAQLKKVVEELEDDYALAHDVEKYDASGRVCKAGCRGCAMWQALLKEVE